MFCNDKWLTMYCWFAGLSASVLFVAIQLFVQKCSKQGNKEQQASLVIISVAGYKQPEGEHNAEAQQRFAVEASMDCTAIYRLRLKRKGA